MAWTHFLRAFYKPGAIFFTHILAPFHHDFAKICLIQIQSTICYPRGDWHFLNHHTSLMVLCPFARWMRQKSDTIANIFANTIADMVEEWYYYQHGGGLFHYGSVKWWYSMVDGANLLQWYCSVSLMTGGETAMMWNYFDRLCDWWTFFATSTSGGNVCDARWLLSIILRGESYLYDFPGQRFDGFA